MSGSTDLLFVVYIRKSHLKNTYIFFSKIHQHFNNMKKVIEDMNVFGKYFRVGQEVSDEIQTNISFNKDKLQTSIENNISRNTRKEKPFWWNGDGLK